MLVAVLSALADSCSFNYTSGQQHYRGPHAQTAQLNRSQIPNPYKSHQTTAVHFKVFKL